MTASSASSSPPGVLLDVRDLRTYFRTESGVAKAVDGVSFQVREDEVLGIVGESGSGKSVTSLSILRLIPNPPGEIVGGEIRFKGQNLLALSWPDMRRVRGREIAMVFQEPMTSLNPVFTVGFQVAEVIRQHQEVSKKDAEDRAVAVLEEVGIPDARRRLRDYPHQFSGGMRQRVMIAIALACNPALLIADEPTTALDVTIQAQILELMLRLKERRKGSAILLITHNLAVVAETCRRVLVMYGGKIQEIAPVKDLFRAPLHPYTRGLLGSIPWTDAEGHGPRRLRAIPGMVPDIFALPAGCKFCTRCDVKVPRCETEEPELRELAPGRWVRCHEAKL
ncbi:MAG: ABC transporter ATP-binding protein [Planctomycetes bacterium]|nr:ABC transporter ATP-binding protein [Planctomycetota bacterium]